MLLAGAAFGALIGVDAAGGIVDTVGTVIVAPAVLVLYFGYAPFLMRRPGRRNGQTWGKQALGIAAVRDDGTPFGFGSAALREVLVKDLLIGFAGAAVFAIPYLLDSLWPLWDGSNRALHDMMVKTHVVRA